MLYSYQDVVALRTFVYLRESESLQLIRAALGTLRDMGNLEHLSNYSLVSGGKKILLVEPDHVIDLTKHPRHYVMAPLHDVYRPFDNLQGARVVDLEHPRKLVEVDPDRLGGYPVIAGTRVQFDLVSSLVDDGVPPAEIKDFYPSVSAAAAKDATSFARLVAEYRNGGMPTAA